MKCKYLKKINDLTQKQIFIKGMLQKDSTACTSKFVSLFLWELLTERGINIHFDQEPLLSQQELPV